MKISLCIPTYNRSQMTTEALAFVINDDRISEIIICDDGSTDGSYEKLQEYFNGKDKVKIFKNETNAGSYLNKKETLSHATNDWCILLDSDNIISVEYLNVIYGIEVWNEQTIYTPCFSMPSFDFAEFSGLLISKENVAAYLEKEKFDCLLNNGNYFINRNALLPYYDLTGNPYALDALFIAYPWLRDGNKIKVVEGLQYIHRIHSGSHTLNEIHRTVELNKEIYQALANLS